MKKTKVICTIGPASDSVEVMGKMVNVGMNCARINLSHATEDEILKTIDVVREVRKISNLPVAIMYDTKGPEFRTLKFKDGGVTLKQGDTIKMSKSCIQGNENEFGVNHSDAIDFINVGDKVLIDNALFELEVVEKENGFVQLKALGDGKIENHKSINVPGVNLGLDFMSDMDRNDINFAARHSCDYLALSFVNAREDVITAREIIEKAGGDALIISKIESRRGIENIDEIIDESDGIMVARGDLGVDVPMEELPVLQKSIIKKCRQKGKFAIVATEMLASMYESPRPTRAEVSDVANAILDGTDCVMLSGETTIGKYPVPAVAIMSKICEYVESTIDYSKNIDYIGSIGISDAIAKLVADAVEYADIKLIVTPTMTGFTARKISNLRPNSIIMACCPSKHIAEKVVLNFGVEPVITDIYESTDEMVESAMEIAKTEFNLNKGDLIVVTGGFPMGEARRTNYLRIVEI
ncbi:pyruvate kinase [Methanobrevibacter sp.]|uniref:pyruvate kinase n=1 Tax=Methanobrevibacter sp. TaxID=66852 RepID=UPI002E7954C9|nr:pyruvate kinase [Methanobrevibacter sp.]MEE0940177.1 pyruvate kinase [Methanobrevibacter sp.]